MNGKQIILVWSVMVVLMSLMLAHCARTKEDKEAITSPVEETWKIDSATKENNKLIIEVNNLDSIKDAKTIEVKSLDNDSTLKLFYQLISK